MLYSAAPSLARIASHIPAPMAKEKTLFTCSACGGTSPRWLGKCPSCGAWNTLVETVAEAEPGKNRYSAASFTGLAQAQAVQPLAAIEARDFARTASGLEELDRVLGGGIVEGGVADLCILEPQARWSVRADTLRSQGKHTPFLGYELPGRVRWTLVGGAVAFERA